MVQDMNICFSPYITVIVQVSEAKICGHKFMGLYLIRASKLNTHLSKVFLS